MRSTRGFVRWRERVVRQRRVSVPDLVFRIKKRRDADAMLVLVREDGSTTTSAIGRPDGYGPVHDLCHYVIESTLGLSEGFLGLVASGWEIADFEVKGAVARLPVQAFLAESAAGELSRQAMMWQYSSAEDFVWSLKTILRNGHQDEAIVPEIDDATFEAMRSRLLELRAQWNEVPLGGTLELRFHAPARPNESLPPRLPGADPRLPSRDRRR